MGKHSKGKYAEKNKKSLILVISAIICIILGIIIYLNQDKFGDNREEEPEKIINSTFLALKEGRKEEASKYLNYEELITSLDEMILKNNQEGNSTIEKELFNDMEWNVENVTMQDGEAIAVIEVTNKDFKEMITKWLKELVNEKSGGKVISQEIGLAKLEEILMANESKKSVIKKIKLTSEGESWKLEVNDDLRDLVFPGIDSVTSILD